MEILGRVFLLKDVRPYFLDCLYELGQLSPAMIEIYESFDSLTQRFAWQVIVTNFSQMEDEIMQLVVA